MVPFSVCSQGLHCVHYLWLCCPDKILISTLVHMGAYNICFILTFYCIIMKTLQLEIIFTLSTKFKKMYIYSYRKVWWINHVYFFFYLLFFIFNIQLDDSSRPNVLKTVLKKTRIFPIWGKFGPIWGQMWHSCLNGVFDIWYWSDIWNQSNPLIAHASSTISNYFCLYFFFIF